MVWDTYPVDYRTLEIQEILTALRAGECCAVAGLSGAGKSNLLGFLANRQQDPFMVLVDCNALPEISFQAMLSQAAQSMGLETGDSLVFEHSLRTRLEQPPGRVCLVLDRFDHFMDKAQFGANLRALRDRYKYRLTYVIAARQLPNPDSELAELFFAHSFWLKPLVLSDAYWSIQSYAARHGVCWSEAVLARIFEFSHGYPAFMRAICEAYHSGVSLELPELAAAPAVKRRVAEFIASQPTPEQLKQSGLEGLPLLDVVAAAPTAANSPELTAKEALLLEYFQAHPQQVIEKDELIKAVWPEDQVFMEGVRDDSLAQLIRRLRRKLEPDPAVPHFIHNVPGRGYRFTP
jgi:hypothetical protein